MPEEPSIQEGQEAREERGFLQEMMATFRKEVVDPFVHFAHAPRALWAINLSYLLEGLVYFGILTVLGKYLSEDVGLSDLHAGWVYSLFTGGITAAMLILGGVADKIGVRKALLAALGLMVGGRFLLAASGTFFEYHLGAGSPMFFFVLAGLFLVVVGYGMYQPASYAGVKEFTNKKTAAMGYAMIYAVMNLGAFFSGLLSPPVRKGYGIVGVFWVYTGLTFLAFLTIFFLLSRRAAEAARAQVKLEDEEFAKESGEGKGKEEEGEKAGNGGEKAEKRSLREPVTLLFGGGLTAVVVILLALVIGREIPPLEKVYLDYQEITSRAIRRMDKSLVPLEKLKPAPGETIMEPDRILEQAGLAVGKLAGQVKPPSGKDYKLDRSAFPLARASLKGDSELLLLLAGVGDPRSRLVIPKAGADPADKVLRSHAVLVMAAAYGLEAPVDAKVVHDLRLRLKRVKGEDIIPMDRADREAAVRIAGLPPAEMVEQLARRFESTGIRMDEFIPPPMNQPFRDVMIREAETYRTIARVLAGGLGPVARKFLAERLFFSALLSKDAGDLVHKAGKPGVKPSERPLLGKLGAKTLDRMHEMGKALAGILPEAAVAPWNVRFKAFLFRYGILVLLGLFFLVGLVWRILVLRPDHPFHNVKFTFFIFSLIPVQTLFAHNWLTMPYYINRAFGGTAVGDNFEFFSNINPILIFFLTPLVAAVTSRAKVYTMMVLGTLVMALPTFLLAFQPSPVFLLTYILFMSIGEAMWSPRFLQLVAEIAPEGKTGAYMGIAQLPWFLTKVVTGFYSGYFLSLYCPKLGPQNTQTLWFIYGCIALVTPAALMAAKGWIGASLEEKHK